jgi:hypothetical protein
MKKLILLLVLFALAFAIRVAAEPDGKPPFSHVYYLFISHDTGCEECYIPMLITRAPFDKPSLDRGPIENVVVITFERDSIWQWKDPIPLDSHAVLLPERTLRWNKKLYRYQEVDRSEAIRLLLNPLGTIPISRRGDPHDPGPSMEQLIPGIVSDLKSLH